MSNVNENVTHTLKESVCLSFLIMHSGLLLQPYSKTEHFIRKVHVPKSPSLSSQDDKARLQADRHAHAWNFTPAQLKASQHTAYIVNQALKPEQYYSGCV